MMAISSDLMLGILSMDVYNRAGDGTGFTAPQLLNSAGDATKVGDATISKTARDSGLNLPSGTAASVGFFAVAYSLGSSTVISYRGTATASFGVLFKDAWNGWGIGTGSPYGQQAADAVAFFNAVAGGTPTTTAAYPNITVTGHSLGGGLAGLVGTLYGEKGVVFDNEPYGAAADAAYASAANTNDPDGFGQATDNALETLIYGSASPFAPSESGLTAFSLAGEVLQLFRGGQSLRPTALDPAGNDALAPLQLHSMALLNIRMYAEPNNSAVGTDWKPVGQFVYSALFNDQLAQAVGLVSGPIYGNIAPNSMMQEAIAYTALSTNAPFGTTALQSFYHDADILGNLVSGGQLSALSDIAPMTGTGTYASGSFGLVEQALADVIVQYAGDQAVSSATDQKFSSGAFATASQELFVNLDPGNWAATYDAVNNSAGQKNIVGVGELGSVLLKSYANDQLDSNSNAAEFAFINSLGGQVSDIAADATEIQVSTASGASLDATAAPKAYDGEPGGAILVGNPGDGTITAGDGDNLIFGGQNIVAGDGDNIIIPEGDGCIAQVGLGTDVMIGSRDAIYIPSADQPSQNAQHADISVYGDMNGVVLENETDTVASVTGNGNGITLGDPSAPTPNSEIVRKLYIKGNNNGGGMADGSALIVINGNGNAIGTFSKTGYMTATVNGNGNVIGNLYGQQVEADVVGNNNIVVGQNVMANFSGDSNIIFGSGSGSATVVGNANTLVAGSGDTTLVASGTRNALTGGSGNDTLQVQSGSGNTLAGGAGNNTLDGGSGSNTADYSAAPAGVSVDLGAGTASNGYV